MGAKFTSRYNGHYTTLRLDDLFLYEFSELPADAPVGVGTHLNLSPTTHLIESNAMAIEIKSSVMVSHTNQSDVSCQAFVKRNMILTCIFI